MCACTETDVRESANDCTLDSGEGHSSRGETFQPLYATYPVYSSAERPVLKVQRILNLNPDQFESNMWCKKIVHCIGTSENQ
jgi:hypothetical protein